MTPASNKGEGDEMKSMLVFYIILLTALVSVAFFDGYVWRALHEQAHYTRGVYNVTNVFTWRPTSNDWVDISPKYLTNSDGTVLVLHFKALFEPELPSEMKLESVTTHER